MIGLVALLLTDIANVEAAPHTFVTADREDLIRVLGDLNADFVCPQFLASEAERAQEIVRFSVALAEIGLSFADATTVRRAFLKHHHCRAILPPAA